MLKLKPPFEDSLFRDLLLHSPIGRRVEEDVHKQIKNDSCPQEEYRRKARVLLKLTVTLVTDTMAGVC